MALNVNQPKSKLGFNATWSMAVAGMDDRGEEDLRCVHPGDV